MNLKFVRHVSERERAIRPFVIVKNKLMSVFNESVLLLIINSYFDNVMTKFMINNRTDVRKTDVNLLTRSLCGNEGNVPMLHLRSLVSDGRYIPR